MWFEGILLECISQLGNEFYTSIDPENYNTNKAVVLFVLIDMQILVDVHSSQPTLI